MRWLLKILAFLFIIFVLNLVFYYVSDDYRTLLQRLKYSDQNITKQKEILLGSGSIIQGKNIGKSIVGNEIWWNKALSVKENEIAKISIHKKPQDNVSNIVLGNNYLDILKQFLKHEDLKQIKVNTSLFEITDEYPDYYYEYYSKELTLYFFPTRTYSEIFDLFNYLTTSLSITLNSANNFWEKSFYINLNENIKDDFVRIVVSKNGIVWGLKIKKDEYNRVKDILNNILGK